MKTILLTLLTLVSVQTKATQSHDLKTVTIDKCYGEVRYGGLLEGAPVFLKLQTLLTVELTKRNIQVEQSRGFYGDIAIDCRYIIDRDTFYSLLPKGKMKLSFKDSYSLREIKSLDLVCAPSINDGGNVTIKKSCVKRMAKKVKQYLKGK